MYVKILAADDYEFIIKRRYAETSQTLTDMLRGPGEPSETDPQDIDLKHIA
jgi:hypothetical protein